MGGIGDSLDRGWHFTRRAFEDGLHFAKHNIFDVASYLVVATFIAIIGILLAVFFGVATPAFLGDSVGLLGASAVGGVIALIIILGTLTYVFAAQFGAIEYIYTKKRVPYFEGKNASLGFKWTVFIFAITLILIAVFTLLILGLGSVPIVSLIAFLVLMFLAIFLIIFLIIAMYFVYQELAIKKKGPWEALIGSYNLVKNNFWETVLFGIILWIASYLVTMIPAFIFYMVLMVGIGLSMISPFCLGIVLVAFIIYILVILVIESAILIVHTGFYKELVTEPKGAAAKAKVVAKKAKPKKKKKAKAKKAA